MLLFLSQSLEHEQCGNQKYSQMCSEFRARQRQAELWVRAGSTPAIPAVGSPRPLAFPTDSMQLQKQLWGFLKDKLFLIVHGYFS